MALQIVSIVSYDAEQKKRQPLQMLLNDVKEDGDRIRAGEEASSVSYVHSKTMSATGDSPWGFRSEGRGRQGLEIKL